MDPEAEAGLPLSVARRPVDMRPPLPTLGLVVIALAILALPASLGAQEPDDGCVSCHRGLDDEALSRPTQVFETDIPTQHMWSPTGGRYRVLWERTYEVRLP